jgi:hypothetical protein
MASLSVASRRRKVPSHVASLIETRDMLRRATPEASATVCDVSATGDGVKSKAYGGGSKSGLSFGKTGTLARARISFEIISPRGGAQKLQRCVFACPLAFCVRARGKKVKGG